MRNLAIGVLIIAVVVLGYLLLQKGRVKPVETELPDTSETPPDSTEEETSWFMNEPAKKVISEDTEVLTINASYPVFGSGAIDSEIKSYVQKAISDFKTENSEPYPGQPVKNSFGTNYRVVEGPDTVSVIMNTETYTGGAHGNLVIKTFVYSKDGNHLSIGSFFKPGSDYLSKLSTLSRAKLAEKSSGESWDEDGTAPLSENFGAFYIGETGKLIIIFQPYQVGPWVAGTPSVEIDFNEFGDMVND